MSSIFDVIYSNLVNFLSENVSHFLKTLNHRLYFINRCSCVLSYTPKNFCFILCCRQQQRYPIPVKSNFYEGDIYYNRWRTMNLWYEACQRKREAQKHRRKKKGETPSADRRGRRLIYCAKNCPSVQSANAPAAFCKHVAVSEAVNGPSICEVLGVEGWSRGRCTLNSSAPAFDST